MHLTQLKHLRLGRRIAVVEGESLVLLDGYSSAYDLAQAALAAGTSLASFASSQKRGESLPYREIHEGRSDWKLLVPFDHPTDPARCHVTGTGLTHINSAKQRDAMHAKEQAAKAPLTDSMKIFQWGIEGGKPADFSRPGVQPEWFYKGNGHILRAHGQPLEVPAFADDGGDEAELAGIYLIDAKGQPRRVGMCAGNEFSDHQMERKNYLYLAPSKLRTASLGPELWVDFDFHDIKGQARVERGKDVLWQRDLASGEANMSHSLANLEHHHFKYAQHRVAGDVHVHFWGADAFSFGGGITLQQGDVMSVEWKGYGKPLRNPLHLIRGEVPLLRVTPL
ncbi:MAG: hypothetical protein IT444_10705 [Phycisphaeraceae bacterium]|nr:hypothetical protein [Phycisphaeraceae bacterium]